MSEQKPATIDLNEFVAALKEINRFAAEFENTLNKAFEPIDPWFAHFFDLKPHVADLEHMIRSAQREVVILGTLGLFQPGVLALRSFFELTHSWPYYAEHPREWLAVKEDSAEIYFETPGRGEKTITRLVSGTRERMRILRDTLHLKNTYSDLSKYAHSSNAYERVIIRTAADLVRSRNEIVQLRRLTEDSVKYLAAWFCAVLSRDHWTELPSSLRQWIAASVPNSQLDLFK